VVLLLSWAYLLALGDPGAYAATGREFWLDVAVSLGVPTAAAGVRRLE